MAERYINRRLIIDDKEYSEHEVLEKGPVIIVRAEPGAGKTALLVEFGRIWGVLPVRASVFRHREREPKATRLIVDAVDEAAKVDPTAVDGIVAKAHNCSNGQVIFAGRSSEWSESRTLAIRDWFGTDPVIVRLAQFTPDEQRRLFGFHFPNEDFGGFEQEIDRFELSHLLGNPQFLLLFAEGYIQSDRHFSAKSQIFAKAIESLALEASPTATDIRPPPTEEVIATACEVMAKLLLSGSSGVSSKERLASIDYPYLRSVSSEAGDKAFRILDTRLFAPSSTSDLHEPVHRIVAEYCAARYIVRRLTDGPSRVSFNRVLAVIAPNGVVRDDLRGLLGWMASIGPERVQQAAIDLDPYAVLANGDPSRLAGGSKRRLLYGLENLAKVNPGFRRGDYGRTFSVGGFVTTDIAESVKRILGDPTIASSLVDLVLDMIAASGGPISLANDTRRIFLAPKREQHTRIMAARAFAKLGSCATADDLQTLISQATPTALRVAADIITRIGAGNVDDDIVGAFLRAWANSYPLQRNHRDSSASMLAYYLSKVIQRLPAGKAALQLDRLTDGLACTCNRPEHDCRCRNGVSKVAARLLDRYFETATGTHDPDRLWSWVRALWFRYGSEARKGASIRALADDHELRHEMHKRAFANLTNRKEANEVFWSLVDGHGHSGLTFRGGDEVRMAEFAFETDNSELWTIFWRPPRRQEAHRGPDTFRRRLRKQAATKREFATEWAERERGYLLAQRQQKRRQRRRNKHLRRNRGEEEQLRARLAEQRELVESGKDLDWATWFADHYFSDPSEISKYTDDVTFVETTLRNGLSSLEGHIPTLLELAKHEHWNGSQLALVSCWLQFKDRGSLDHIERDTLIAVKIIAYRDSSISEADYEAFQHELDRHIFRDEGDAEVFARTFVEPGLQGPREGPSNVWWLTKKQLTHFRPSLSIEWLRAYPDMPISARKQLFDMAAETADHKELLEVIEERVAALKVAPPAESDEQKEHRLADLHFWRLRKFFFAPSASDGWSEFYADKNTIFDIDEKAGRFGDIKPGWPELSAEKVFKILDAFVEAWPPVFLPSTFGTGDPPDERAYRFIRDIVWRIDRDLPERALPVIDRVLADNRFSQFDEALRTQRVEAERKLAHWSFKAPTPKAVVSMFDATGIASVEDLRAFVVDELGWLQDWLRTAETNPLDTYYEGENPVDENTARNRVVDSLKSRVEALNMPIDIERHMAGGNRCDITVTDIINGCRRLLVVEAKGQWHNELYTAAATQLKERYASHQDAEGQGIYLVFWFGPKTKVGGRRKHGIDSAAELREDIVDKLPKDLRASIDVFVLDLSKEVRKTLEKIAGS